MKTAKDFLCMAQSPEGFICNREPNHDGDHVAMAAPMGGTQRVEVDRWPNERRASSDAEGDRADG